jgi:hypothetical protein
MPQWLTLNVCRIGGVQGLGGVSLPAALAGLLRGCSIREAQSTSSEFRVVLGAMVPCVPHFAADCVFESAKGCACIPETFYRSIAALVDF